MTTATRDKLTITLTGRPPVTLDKGCWPLLAEATTHLYNGQYDFQSFTHTRAAIRVRQHTDGRAVVYGTYSYDTAYQGARDASARRGRLLPAGVDIPEAILKVAEEMDAARENCGVGDHFSEARPFERLAAECIADLPAEAI